MSFFRENDWRDDLGDQLSELRREIASLRRDATRSSRSALSSTRHAGEDLIGSVRNYLFPRESFYERSVHTARDNPGTTAAAAIVGIALIGIAASFFYSGNPFQRSTAERIEDELDS